MNTRHDSHSTKRGRDNLLQAEQILCDKALESSAYDSMSDRDWVALCEQVATEARQAMKRDDTAAPLEAKP